jgi:hypothetical protein
MRFEDANEMLKPGYPAEILGLLYRRVTLDDKF